MGRNICSMLFPLFFSFIPPFLYLLLNAVEIDEQKIEFAFLIYFVNLGWISFIHLYKKGCTVILSIYLTVSITSASYIVFLSLDSNFQYFILYGLLIIGVIGLSFFIKRKEKIGEI